MKVLSPLGAWIAGGAAVALVAGGVLLLGASAHAANGGAATATTTQACPTPSTAQIQAAQQQYAKRLAQALGKPEQEVEQALQQVAPPEIGLNSVQVHGEMQVAGTPPAGAVATKGTLVVGFDGDPSMLAPAAQQLGVTPQQLADAFKAATKNVKPPPALSCASAGPDVAIVTQGAGVDLFAAVAQQLGHGISAAQVRDAMRLVQPPSLPAPDSQLKATNDQYLQSLAAVLHVSVEQLQAAMQSASDCRAPSSDEPATPAAGVTICYSIAGQAAPPPAP